MPSIAKYRVVIDFDRCEGQAQCMAVAPDIFQVDDDSWKTRLLRDPTEQDRDMVEEAARRCPQAAISLLDT